MSKVCEATGWVIGQAWIPRPDGSGLQCSSAWHCRVSGVKEFRQESERSTFAPNVGGTVTWIINPSLVNEFIMGWADWREKQIVAPDVLTKSSVDSKAGVST